MSTFNSPDQSERAARVITETLFATGGVATHATARLIAAAINDGPDSALARFASTGRFDPEVLLREVEGFRLSGRQEGWRLALRDYVLAVRKRPHPWVKSAIAETTAIGKSRQTEARSVQSKDYGEADITGATPTTSASSRPGKIDQSLVLTIPEAANRLRVSMWTIYRLIREHKLQTIQIGTRRLVPLFAIQRFLRSQTENEGDRG